jgi:uncharacterized protein YeaO (DUF488 family)
MRPALITTRRWNDPAQAGEGHRILVCRYRPRGVRKEDETWDEWCKDLGPSPELHADFYGKRGPPISFEEYQRRYLQEMRTQKSRIAGLGDRLRSGERLTLLCSSNCVDPLRCHRTLLKRLIEAAAKRSGARHGQ